MKGAISGCDRFNEPKAHPNHNPMAKKKIKGKITIDRERCKGCGLCISVCPQGTITRSNVLNQMGYYPAEFKPPENEEKGCIACAMCATICPDIAIEVYRE
jgi:2-oxoglutarate ferredoxin oxidoreductase subunit delta